MKPDIGIHFIIAIYFWFVSWTSQMTAAAIDIPIEYLTEPHKICKPIPKSSCDGVDQNTAAVAAMVRVDEPRDYHEPDGWRNCQCDEECREYGDCCYNSEYFNVLQQESAAIRYTCVKTYTSDERTTGAYAVAKCPPEWTDEKTRASCETPVGAEQDGMLSNPVTSNLTGLTYRNWFCAICNGGAADPVVWNTRLVCGNLSAFSFDAEEEKRFVNTLRYNGTEESWTVEDFNKTLFKCDLMVSPPSTLINVIRPCLADAVTACDPKWLDNYSTNRLKLDCGSYTTVVYDHNMQPYKNIQCAMCNYVPVQNLSCDNTPRMGYDINKKFNGLKPFTKILSANKLGNSYYDEILKRVQNLTLPGNANGTAAPRDSTRSSCDDVNGTAAAGCSASSDDESYKAAVLTYVGLAVSVLFLTIHLAVFAVLPEMKNLSGKNLASLCVSLLGAYAAFVAGNWTTGPACYADAVLTYYCFLASFAWMLIISFDCWRGLRLATVELRVTTGPQTKKFLVYSAVCWLVPAMVAFVAVTADTMPYWPAGLRPAFNANDYCWFGNDRALYAFFVGPLTTVMAVNIALFVWTAYIIHSSRATVRHVNTRHVRRDFRMYCRMFVLMGLTWTVGVAAYKMNNNLVWILFIVLNTFQGLFVFLAFTCRRRIFHSLLGGHDDQHEHSSSNNNKHHHRATPPSFSWSSSDNTVSTGMEKTSDTLY